MVKTRYRRLSYNCE